MTRLIVYAGPNGAGKSTLRDIGDDLVEVEIDPDRIAREISAETPAAAQIEAGRAAIRLFRRSVSEGKTISLETTLSGQTILQRMVEAKRVGYVVELRFVALASADIHISRVEQRVMKGGHDIPHETIIRRYEASLDNLPKALALAHKATVIDNSGVEKRTILRAERGVILELASNPPRWFQSRWPEIQRALATHTGPAV